MSSWLFNPGEPWGTPSGKTPNGQSPFRDQGGPRAGSLMIPPAIRLTFPDDEWSNLNSSFAEAHPFPEDPGGDLDEWLAEFRRPRVLRNLIDRRGDRDEWHVAIWQEAAPNIGYPWAAGWVDFGLAYGNVWAVWYGKDHDINVDPDSLPISVIPNITYRFSRPDILFPDERWFRFTNTQNIEAGGIGQHVKTEPLWNDRMPWLTG